MPFFFISELGEKFVTRIYHTQRNNGRYKQGTGVEYFYKTYFFGLKKIGLNDKRAYKTNKNCNIGYCCILYSLPFNFAQCGFIFDKDKRKKTFNLSLIMISEIRTEFTKPLRDKP